MPCYRPLKGWRAKNRNESGKRGIVFNVKSGFADMPVELPCNQCIGCRLERSRQWAIRCVHEAQLHDENAFITLTYDDANLPEGGTLVLKHYQDFMKRLRWKHRTKEIRFFHCGEYGEDFGRPHYHAVLFGIDFEDKQFHTEQRGNRIYVSEELEQLWGKGFTTCGDVTFESAAYVARYIMKKVTGDDADDHYLRLDPETGEIHKLKPEYTTMSRRPGIAHDWYQKYKREVFPSDSVVIRGRQMKPPKYYTRQHEEETTKEEIQKLKGQRKKHARRHAKDQTSARLRTREKVKTAQANQLKRKIQ